VSVAAAPRASAEERERLTEDFERLCRIESPSLRERQMADAVTTDLRALGFVVEEDGSAEVTGSDAGNLLARAAGRDGSRSILLCAHLDTVPLDAPVVPVRENGMFRNAEQGILGADNKAAVAVLLGVARRLAREPAQVGVELLFTTGEELALRGAKEVAAARGGGSDGGLDLRSEFGFVFDHASPIGELVVASPTYYRLAASFRGAAAHAGIRPEDGRNAVQAAARAVAAMHLGRLDDATTANVGTIEGGTAANVVAERCAVELEARSLDAGRAAETVGRMVDACVEAAADLECDVETVVEELFRGYRLSRSAAPVRVAAAALESLSIEPLYVESGGGSDANALIAAGLPMLNVANGTERNHQPDECVSAWALETMLDVALAIVDCSAAA
jgi:tripeptide aminopeptidase